MILNRTTLYVSYIKGFNTGVSDVLCEVDKEQYTWLYVYYVNCDIIPITKAGNVIWRRNFHLFSRTDMTRTELQKQANGKTYDRLTELKIFGILMTLSLHIQKIFLHKQRGRKPTFGESQLYNSLTPGGKTTIYAVLHWGGLLWG